MEVARQTVRKVVMPLLFCVAFFTTFQSISGVSAEEFSKWAIHKSFISGWFEKNVPNVNYNDTKGVGVVYKTLPTIEQEHLAMNHVIVGSDIQSIDDIVDWSQYPTQKVVATGYTAGYESTGKNPGHPSYGITYSGVEVRRDLYSTIAADPSLFPIGSILYIPGYGYGVVADTGSAIKGNKIDLYYDTISDVYEQWGKREVEVFVVKRGTGKLSEHELNALNENEAVQVFRRQFAF